MSGSSIDAIASSAPAAASASESAVPYKNPLLWVPTSYLAMGLVYVTVGSMATIMFTNMGMTNAQVAFWSSALGAPYIVKFLWAPLLELYKTKKFFVTLMQFVLPILLTGVAFALKLPGKAYVVPVLVLMALAALAGATQDIGTDGVYVTTLKSKDQARYQAFQSMCWNFGPLLASGPLTWISGNMFKRTHEWGTSWMIVMLIIAGLMLLVGLYHLWALPTGDRAQNAPRNASEAMHTFGHAFSTFVEKKGIVAMVAFALFYRSAYALIEKMSPIFMVNARAAGGLGLSNETYSTIYGTVGTIAFVVGSLAGGFFVAKRGLKKSLLILCLAFNIPNIAFLYLAQTVPFDLNIVTIIVAVEKFAWGFGAIAHMTYMMQQIAPGPYRTAHYSIATGLMGMCMIGLGMLSGKIQEAVGFQTFFVIAAVAMIPSILVTLLAPFHVEDESRPAATAEGS